LTFQTSWKPTNNTWGKPEVEGADTYNLVARCMEYGIPYMHPKWFSHRDMTENLALIPAGVSGAYLCKRLFDIPSK
jgi:hypothetical protein